MKSQLFTKTLKAARYKHFLLISSQMLHEFILLINVKMPTFVGIVRKQPIIALYFEFENELKLYIITSRHGLAQNNQLRRWPES